MEGLSKRNDGTPEKLEIKRVAPDSAKTMFYKFSVGSEAYRLPAIPDLPPSSPTPEGGITLELKVGDILGRSDRNLVYAVTITNTDKLGCSVPPLVMKVAKYSKGRNVSEEAGMYQDLECLQGSVIPRCYGYFFTIIDRTQLSILPWDGANCRYPRVIDRYDPPHPAAPLSIMLLERLGDPIPTGNGKISEEIR